MRELLKRGASVDLPSSLGSTTALTVAAGEGHLPTLLVLLQHSANPLKDVSGITALMRAAGSGHEACVQALLRAKAIAEQLLDNDGRNALHWAEVMGHPATAALLRQHALCLPLGLSAALCAALPPRTWSWVALSMVLGAIGVVAARRTLTGRPDEHRAARQRRPHCHARHAKAQGKINTEETSRQLAAPPQPAAAAVPRAKQAARPRAEDATEEPVFEEAEQARSTKSKKKGKVGRATAAGKEPSEAPSPATPAPPPAIADGGLSALEEGGVGAEAAAAVAAAEMAARRRQTMQKGNHWQGTGSSRGAGGSSGARPRGGASGGRAGGARAGGGGAGGGGSTH